MVQVGLCSCLAEGGRLRKEITEGRRDQEATITVPYYGVVMEQAYASLNSCHLVALSKVIVITTG